MLAEIAFEHIPEIPFTHLLIILEIIVIQLSNFSFLDIDLNSKGCIAGPKVTGSSIGLSSLGLGYMGVLDCNEYFVDDIIHVVSRVRVVDVVSAIGDEGRAPV